MARTETVIERERVTVDRRFYWPSLQLTVWLIMMLASGGTILGVNAAFYQIQTQMQLDIPWLFPFAITVASLTIVFIMVVFVLTNNNQLTPGIMLVGGLILFAFYITGMIETAIQLFGAANVAGNCAKYIAGHSSSGVSVDTFAWLEQDNICNCWDAEFAFWLIGALFLIWVMVMAAQVNRHEYDLEA